MFLESFFGLIRLYLKVLVCSAIALEIALGDVV